MFSMEQESQEDYIIIIGTLKYLVRFAVVQHSIISSLFYSTHQGIGKYLLPSLTKENKGLAAFLMTCISAKGVKQSTKNSPLSGIAQTLAFFVCSAKQLAQKQVPIPPAETPVKTIVYPLQKSNLSSKNLNCSKTLLYPLKQSLASLQEMGFSTLPVYSLPSQQTKAILVQSWKTGLFQGKGDIRPLLSAFLLGTRLTVDPSPVLLLLQHDYRAYQRVNPEQKPPLFIQMMNLFLLSPLPSIQYRPAGEPSKHLAPRSVGSSWRVNNSSVRITRGMIDKISKVSTLIFIILSGAFTFKRIELGLNS